MLERLTIIVALATAAFAQQPMPEVRGVIHEADSTTGIAGVEVGLYQFRPNEQNFITRQLVMSTFTDAKGGYSLKPGHMGEFSISAKRNGYQGLDGLTVTLSADAPVQTASMTLIRPGSLTGRVVNGNGNPVANFTIYVETAALGYEDEQRTDMNGYFTSNNLRPGEYVVSLKPRLEAREELLEYSEDAFKIIDEDVEPSFWPGGLPDREKVLPVPVAGGAIANVGTIVVRKTPYYRAHVSRAGECAPNERWIYRIITKPLEFPPPQEQFGGCRKEFLITGLKPGEHTLAVWVGRDLKAWGLVPFTVTNANVEVTLRMSPSFNASGQVKASEGHTLAELGPVEILLRPEDGLGAIDTTVKTDGSGAFNLKTVAWPQQLISVYVQKPGTYVKEIRYNGLPIGGPRVNMIPGARFEILLDSGTATLTLTAKLDGRDYVLAVRDGAELGPLGGVPPFQMVLNPERRVPGEETFTIANFPPGTYRILVIGRDYEDRNMSTEEFAQLVSRAERVTLGANETKTINVRK